MNTYSETCRTVALVREWPDDKLKKMLRLDKRRSLMGKPIAEHTDRIDLRIIKKDGGPECILGWKDHPYRQADKRLLFWKTGQCRNDQRKLNIMCNHETYFNRSHNQRKAPRCNDQRISRPSHRQRWNIYLNQTCVLHRELHWSYTERTRAGCQNRAKAQRLSSGPIVTIACQEIDKVRSKVAAKIILRFPQGFCRPGCFKNITKINAISSVSWRKLMLRNVAQFNKFQEIVSTKCRTWKTCNLAGWQPAHNSEVGARVW